MYLPRETEGRVQCHYNRITPILTQSGLIETPRRVQTRGYQVGTLIADRDIQKTPTDL